MSLFPKFPVPWLEYFNAEGWSKFFFPKSALSEKEADENGPLAYIKPIFYRSNEEDVPKIAAYAAIYFSEDAFEEILKKDSSLKGEFSFLINDDLDLVSRLPTFLLFSGNFAITAFESDPDASGQFQLVELRGFFCLYSLFLFKKYRLVHGFPDPQGPDCRDRSLRCP